MQNNELTFMKTIFNDICHVNTKSVLFEHIPHGRNGLIDSLRVIFNDHDTDNKIIICTYAIEILIMRSTDFIYCILYYVPANAIQ